MPIVKKVWFFCSECYLKKIMTILAISKTRKGNWRIRVKCDDCNQEYSLNRRKGFINKIYEEFKK